MTLVAHTLRNFDTTEQIAEPSQPETLTPCA